MRLRIFLRSPPRLALSLLHRLQHASNRRFQVHAASKSQQGRPNQRTMSSTSQQIHQTSPLSKHPEDPGRTFQQFDVLLPRACVAKRRRACVTSASPGLKTSLAMATWMVETGPCPEAARLTSALKWPTVFYTGRKRTSHHPKHGDCPLSDTINLTSSTFQPK